jgi:DNA-binding transcriptional MerR regulator
MPRYTVKQVAELSGVSVRTLHHYDAIGLLCPVTGENGYRYYGRADLMRLQQILFHKTLGLSLADIRRILDDPGFDSVAALAAHRKALSDHAARTDILIETVDRTLTALEDGTAMTDTDFYSGFPDLRQADYESWLIDRYGGEIAKDIGRSKKAYTAMSDTEREAVMNELKLVENGLAEGLRRGAPADSEVHDLLLDRHRAWVAFMWDKPCPAEAYAGLADMYLSHPDFEKRYESIEPGFTRYLTGAMKAYAARSAASQSEVDK